MNPVPKWGEAEFQTASEAAANALILADRRGAICFANDKAAALFGHSKAELTGRRVELLIPERFRARHSDLMAQYWKQPVARPIGTGRDLYGLSKDGKEVPIEIGLHPLQAGGETFVIASIVDITERKALEQRLRDASQLKSDMLSLVSHEFNNSLTSMGLALILLRENDTVPDQRHNLYLILERIQRLLKTTVGNFLNQARMQSGKFRLDIRQIELRRLVAEALELMRPLAEQKGLDLRLECPETVFPVTADPDAMMLVLSNLIGNAIKYTPGPGRVSVRLKPISGDPPQEVEVSVEDTGIGIAAEDQEAIFRGFYRTGESQKTAKGYGLGLMVCRQIMEGHGSSLQVESRLGQGSCFHFRLPICRLDCPNRKTGLCHRCRSRNPLAEQDCRPAAGPPLTAGPS